MKKTLLLYLAVAMSLCQGILKGQSNTDVFEVFYKDSPIGMVKALHTVKGDVSIKDIQTKTEAKILMASIHVESEINLMYKNGVLVKGIAYRMASRGNENIQASTTKNANTGYSVNKNGTKKTVNAAEIKFCVGDLYFTEPKNIKQVFSTMYGEFLELSVLALNSYKIILPGGKSAIYKYVAGKLETIEIEMELGKIISKRKK